MVKGVDGSTYFSSSERFASLRYLLSFLPLFFRLWFS